MAANCVTSQQKKSPEYIGAMEKLDISSSVLELLLFEYQSLPENEEAFSKGELPFPSIEYLQGQLYAPAITVLDGTIIEYYDKHLNDKTFTAKTLQEAKNIAHVIGKRIGHNSVKVVETKNGQYKVLTTRPKLDNSVEIEKILSKAPRDEQGRLLAPNGKPSNLTERQYAQVRTEAFKNWFGDWELFANISEEQLALAQLVFERNPKLQKVGTVREYAAYLLTIFPNSVDKNVYWHGSDSDFSDGFNSAVKGKGSGSPHITNEFYLAKQAWTVLQYVSGVNRKFGPDVNGFNHWNKLWWELKEIMSNGRRENNDWKDLIIGPDNVRQAIPNKKGIFNRDSGGENGKWLKERKADYGYQDKTDAEFFKDVFGIEYGKDTFNTWTLRNGEIFKSLVKTEKGIYPAIINTTNPIRESGKNTYYEPERGLLTQARTKGNDAILGVNTDNEFNSDVAVVFNALKNVHFLGTTQDIESFKKWLEQNRASKVIDEETGEPLVVYHGTLGEFDTFDLQKLGLTTGLGYYTDKITGEKVEVDSSYTFFFTDNLNAAYSYRNLAVGQDNELKEYFYRHLQGLLLKNNYLLTKLNNELKILLREFVDNVLSPVLGFDLRNAINKNLLSEELRLKLAERFRNTAVKIKQLPSSRSVSNQRNNLGEDKNNLLILLNAKLDIINNRLVSYFKDKNLHFVTGYGNRTNGDIYLYIGYDEEKGYYVVSFGDGTTVKLTKDNINRVIEDATKTIKINELDLVKAEKEGQYSTKGTVMPVFLNLRNPLEHDYENSSFPDRYKDTKHATAYVAARQAKEAKANNNDGVIYQNITDPFTMNTFGVFNPNQIKSATDNIGTFSRESGNIYYNKTKELFNIINKINWIEKLDNKQSTEHGLVYKEHGKYYITLGDIFKDDVTFYGDEFEKSITPFLQAHINNHLIAAGLNPNVVKVNITKTGKVELKTADKISKNKKQLISSKSIETVLSFLEAKIPGLNHKVVAENSMILKRLNISDSVNAFFNEGTVYLIEGRFNEDIAIEECLHPLVNAIALENIELYDLLVETARTEFPTLFEEIKLSYKEEDVNKELVTQALSRYTRKEFKEQKDERTKWEQLVNKFFNFVKDLFGIISIKNIKPTTTFKELSQIILSEDGYFNINLSGREYNKDQSQDNLITQTNQLADTIDTLLGIDSILDRSEVQELAYKICIKISDILTAIQEDPSIVENITNGRVKGTPEMSKMKRNKLMQTVGATDIVNYVKELVFGQYNENIADDMFELADLLYENFNTLLSIGMSSFAATEGFSFNFTGNNSIVSDSVESLEDQDEAELSENEGNRLEAWLVEAVTKSVIDRMSQSVKAVLQSCKVLDSNGKPILDKWGLSDTVPLQEATLTIIKVTGGSFTLSDMIEKLEKATTTFPWIQQLLPRLKDKSGKYSQFQSQFYGAIQSHFLLYSVVRTEDGKIATKPVNKDTALSEAKKAVASLYNIRQHPLFDSNGNVNKTSLNQLEELQLQLKNNEIEDKAPVINNILTLLGYNTDPSSIQSVINDGTIKVVSDALHYIIKDLNNHKDDKLSTWKPFSSNPKDKGIINNISKALKPFTDVTIDPTLSSFHSDGKMYQSNKIPSYLTKLFLKFGELPNTVQSTTELTPYYKFLQEEYGCTEWFRDSSEDLGVNVNLEMQKGWRLPWLRMLASDPKAREIFAHKVDISYDKKGYMKSSTGKYMNELEYGLMSIAEYFSETTEKNSQEDKVPAWFRVAMQSNKPSADFIRFYSYRGQNYKQAIVNDLLDVFNQELSRIQTCVMRKQENAKDKSIEISSFDKNGVKFCFLDFLEAKRKDSEFGKLVEKKINGQEINEAKLLSLAELLITESIDLRVLEIYSEFEANGLVKQLSKVKGINTSNIKDSVENFLWNDFLASINILQLTITDVAYYKNAEDLQKRLAQIHAPGTRPNIEARDLEGNEVTDGTYRTIILEDFEGFKSNVVENLRYVFDLELAKLSDDNPNKAAAEATYAKIIKQFEKEVNVTDALGYSCPTSYRKKALMFGRWSKRHEAIYQKLLKEESTLTDIEEAFGPLKPFVYSSTTRSSYVENAPIKNLKVGVLYKNSEYMLVMADALIRRVSNGRPNLLKAIFKVMEDSYKKDVTKGLDTIQFKSSMKTGISGVLSLNDLVDDSDGYNKAVKRLEDAIYAKNGKDGYNAKHVHASPFEDYCIQQEVPPHFKNHHQAHGSQTRAITPSDLDVNATYKVGDLEYTAQEFIEEYERLITENIKDSYKNLSKELEWSSETNHTEEGRANLRRNLSEILQRELLSSQRHSLDLLFACSLKNGDFRVPLGDAVQSNKIELLINSIIKNRINKQEIAGGPVVQASSFGMSRKLNMVFKDAKDNPLMTLKLYTELGGTVEGFEQYIKDNQGSFSHMEVHAPIYDERLLEFLDADGTIDIKAIEKLNPELLDLVAYRIPTEDKYSIIPCKIVGFVPREAGEVIMMPDEITLLTGSDFDVDKMYLMRKEFDLKRKSQEQIIQAIQEKLPTVSTEQIKNFLLELKEHPYVTRKKYPSVWKAYKESAFEAALPKDLRIVRNNKIVNMTLSVLTHPSTTALQMTPGGFDEQRKVGYMVEAFKLGKGTWQELEKKSINELKDLCYTSKNLNFFDTQLQFYKQNSAAGSILAIFAVAKVAHAIFLARKVHIDVKKAMNIKQKGDFSIQLGDSKLTPMMRLDATHNDLGQYIGKVLGEMVASSADAVKDPVLNLMNINVETVNILNSLLRVGVPFKTAAMFLSSKAITDALNQYYTESLTQNMSFTQVIKNKLKELKQEHNILWIYEGLSNEELLDAIKGGDPKLDIKVLQMFLGISNLASAVQKASFITRFNSMSSAVGPLVIDNLITERKLTEFPQDIIYLEKEGQKTVQTVETMLNEFPILKSFKQTLDLSRMIFGEEIITNSRGFRQMLYGIPENTFKTLMSDRNALSKLGDFFKSAMLISSGVFNSDELKHYIHDFPKEFISKKYKEMFPNNRFVQLLKYNVEKSGRLSLRLELTGMDKKDQDKITAAWLDLYKSGEEGKKLALDLVKYYFFKGGIGFSPKTPLHLLPVQLRQVIPGYMDAFGKKRSLPDAELIYKQFVLNYWQNNKIAPIKKYKLEQPELVKENTYISQEIPENMDGTYFKMKNEEGGYDLFHVDYAARKYAEVSKIHKLGNNGEYIEINSYDLNPMEETISDELEIIDETEQVEVQNTSTQIEDTEQIEVDNKVSYKEQLDAVLDTMLKERLGQLKDMSKGELVIKKWPTIAWMMKQLKAHGIEVTMDLLEKTFEEYC